MLLGILAVISVLSAVGICFVADAFSSLWWLLWLPVSGLGVFLGLAALAFLLLCAMTLAVDLKKPQLHDSKFYRTMAHLYIDAVIKVCRIRIHATGLEKTPGDGRFLLVCNHRHDSDPIVLLTAFRNSQLAFISKRENSSMPFVGKFMHKLMCQPINRENDREALKTILECIRLLKEDEVSVAVFPEGYIHDDRLLHPFRPGVFKIAQRTKVPIVVCTLRNTTTVFSNMAHLKPSDVELRLLTVIQPEEYEGITTVELANRIYGMMADDLGPELVYHAAENT